MRSIAVLVLAVGCAALLPAVVQANTKTAVAVGIVVMAGAVTLWKPLVLPVLAVPGVLLAGQRLGGSGGGGLALGDVLLIGAFVIAVPALRGQPRTIARPVIFVFFAYLLLLTPSLAAFHDRTALVEVVHRITVVVGGLSVGLLLQRAGRLTIALRLLIGASTVVALAAVATTVAHGFTPAYPLGLHKNFAGPVMGRCAALLLIAPTAVDLKVRDRRLVLGMLVIGVAATQSRNAAIALVLATIIWVVRSGGLRGSKGVGAIALISALGGFAAYTLFAEFEASQSATASNSYTERTRVEQQTRDLWRTSPVYGVGLRYYNTPEYSDYEAPNNVFDEILAEAGVFGAAGMAILIVGSVGILARGKGELATAGVALVSCAFVSGQFDIFWVNGQALPWLVAGAGAAADERATKPAVPIALGL